MGDRQQPRDRPGGGTGSIDPAAIDAGPIDEELAAVVARVDSFVDATAGVGTTRSPDPSTDETFQQLARDVVAITARLGAPYRRLCASRGLSNEDLRQLNWRRAPAVPVSAFRTVDLHLAPGREVFRSSGTTGGAAARSVHVHPFPDLYRRVIDASFPSAVLGASDSSRVASDASPSARPPMLALVPSRQTVADSSLGFMVDHILRRFGGLGSTVAIGAGGVEQERAREFCRARRGDGRPAVILATAFALAQWLEGADRLDPLPAGSTVFETGGFKGRHRELERDELLRLIAGRVGVAPTRVVREYGMTELTGHVYSRVLHGGDPDLFVPPAWMRVRALDPATLEPVRPGEPGVLAIFDLANVGSAVHVLSEDLGVLEGDGFRLLGRASDAALRGCSLTAEELAAGRERDRARANIRGLPQEPPSHDGYLDSPA
ncbi:MAG: hypothetical protein AAGN46_09730 [Acidobacteriota bacterium]